jgi:hypothetical protein
MDSLPFEQAGSPIQIAKLIPTATNGLLFDSPCGNQKAGPGHVVEAADLNAGTAVHCVMDEFAAAKIHPCVSDFVSAGSEKQQITWPEGFALNRGRATPGGLRSGIAGHDNSALPQQHLGKSRAVEAEAGDAAPGIGDAEKSPRQLEGFVDAQW